MSLSTLENGMYPSGNSTFPGQGRSLSCAPLFTILSWCGKPSVVGLTKAELISPNRVCIEDQPVSEHVPEGIPAGGILDCSSEDCVDILVLRDCYSKHCANQTTGPTDKLSLRELFDCFSKHCK